MMLGTGDDNPDDIGSGARAEAATVQGGRNVRRSEGRRSRNIILLSAADGGGVRRDPAVRGVVRGGPIGGGGWKARDEDIQILQLVLFRDGGFDAGGGDGACVCARQHWVGMGIWNSHHCYVPLHSHLRCRVPDLQTLGPVG